MQRQPYKHVVLDTMLKRRSKNLCKVAMQRHVKASLKQMKAQTDIDNMVRKMERNPYKENDTCTTEYEAPLKDQPLLYRIWVYLKMFFVGENK